MNKWIEEFNEQQVAQIHTLMINERGCSDRSIDEVRSVIAGSNVTLAALDENQRIVAFARALTDGVFKAVLFDVIVKTDLRGTQLGQKLINQIIRHPSLQHVKSLELYCPDRISGFYTKLGFEISESKLHQYQHSTNTPVS